MTQIPNLPPREPPEPLDAEERAIARVLGNLPAGSPSPELDARILGAARRAVHLAQPRKRPGGWLLGLGTAASALLAIGVFMKMHRSGENALYVPPSDSTSAAPAHATMPRAETEAAKEQVPPATADTIAAPPAAGRLSGEVTTPSDLEKPKPAVAADAGVSARAEQPAMQSAQGIAQQSEERAVAAKQAPNAFPASPAPPRQVAPVSPARSAPPAPPVLSESPAPSSAPAPALEPSPPPPPVEHQAENKAESGFAARRDAPAAAGAPAVAGSVDKDDMADLKKSAPAGNAENAAGSPTAIGGEASRSLDRAGAARNRVQSGKQDEYDLGPEDRRPWLDPPPVAEDTRLSPSLWIRQIRRRVVWDSADDARESLRLYHSRYPDLPIPDDLQPLLK